MEASPAPVLLIGIDEQGKCHLQDDGLAVLRQIPGRVAVVGIAGLYRTGKSFLLNRLLGQQAGFQTGPTVNACTKGIWIWGQPVQLPSGCHCLFLDTEGLGSAHRTASCDMQILSLCVLLSSLFIYNSMGAIDEQGIDDLHLVLHLAKHVRARSGAGGGGDGSAEAGAELAGHFPAFLWVLRDFHLRLVDDGGGTISEKDYLESALEAIPGQDDKNRVRSTIKDLFRDRGCATLVRPATDEGELRHLHSVSYDALRPKFRAQVEALVARVYSEAQPKAVEGKPVSGAVLAGLAEEYCRAINNSAVPTIHSAWTSAVQQQLRVCEKAAFEGYQADVRAMAESMPVGEDRLQELHRAAKARAMAAFCEQKFDHGDPKFQEHRAELARKIKRLYEQLRHDNADASLRQCESVAEQLYGSLVVGKLQARGYASMEELMQDWEQLREAFARETAGPAQSQVMSTLLFQHMTSSVQRLSEDLREESRKDKIVEDGRGGPGGPAGGAAGGRAGGLEDLRCEIDERVGALERRLAAAEGRDQRGCRFDPPPRAAAPRAGHEGHVPPLLTEHARRYREAVAERHARVAALERFHLEAVSSQWRLDALDAQLRAADAASFVGTAMAMSSSSAGGTASDVEGLDDRARRRAALQESLDEIRGQQSAATRALEERAARHTLFLPPDAAGRAEQLPLSEGERAAALEKLWAAAGETYEEIAVEANAILKVRGDAGLGHLRAALRRRREFWQEQLEEAWADWLDAASKMRYEGELAVSAWLEVACIVEDVFVRWRADQKPASSALLRALAACVAQGAEVELLHPLGLRGLDGPPGAPSRASASAWLDKGGPARGGVAAATAFTPQGRLQTLASAMRVLRAAEAQHRVGETALSRALAGGGLLAAAAAPAAGPACGPGAGALAALCALPCAPRPAPCASDPAPSALRPRALAASTVSAVCSHLAEGGAADAAGREGAEAGAALCLFEGVAEAACEAAAAGSLRRTRALLELCRALGGVPLAESVRDAGSRKPARRGATPLQLASAGGHSTVAELLREWPDVDHLRGAELSAGDLDGLSVDGARVRKRDVLRAKVKDVFSLFSSRDDR